MRDVLADALELGLAAELDLGEELGEPVGGDPAGALCSASASHGSSRAATTVADERRRDAVQVGRRTGASTVPSRST